MTSWQEVAPLTVRHFSPICDCFSKNRSAPIWECGAASLVSAAFRELEMDSALLPQPLWAGWRHVRPQQEHRLNECSLARKVTCAGRIDIYADFRSMPRTI
jgi:hypothetical protein